MATMGHVSATTGGAIAQANLAHQSFQVGKRTSMLIHIGGFAIAIICMGVAADNLSSMQSDPNFAQSLEAEAKAVDAMARSGNGSASGILNFVKEQWVEAKEDSKANTQIVKESENEIVFSETSYYNNGEIAPSTREYQ